MVYITLSFTLFTTKSTHEFIFQPRRGILEKKYIIYIKFIEIKFSVQWIEPQRTAIKPTAENIFPFHFCCCCYYIHFFFWAPMCGRAKICNIIIILHISSIYESRDQHPQMYIYRYILVMGHSTFFPHSVNIIIIIIIILSTNISSFIYIHMQIIMHT